jgi:hypothetical protein
LNLKSKTGQLPHRGGRGSAEFARVTGIVWNMLHGFGLAADEDIDSAAL